MSIEIRDLFERYADRYMAAIAARQLDSRTNDAIGDPQLTVYARNADGTVSILDAPSSA